MRFRPRRMTGSLILAAILTVGLVPAVAKSPGGSLKALRQKKQETARKRAEVEAKLRATRRKQSFATEEFYGCERQLVDAQRDLNDVQARQQVIEDRLHLNQARLGKVNKDLEAQTNALWKRLELFYKQGGVGYVEVVLGATDFDQFVDRVVFARSIAAEDLRLKQGIEESKAQQVALHNELQQDWTELDSLKRQSAIKAEEVKVKTAIKYEMLQEIRQDRAAQESAYAEIVATQKDIEAVLWRLNRAPVAGPGQSGGGGGSAGNDSGPVRRLSGGFIVPCNGRFTSPFGWRIHPILGTRRFHDGQDIAAPQGTTIRAAAAGTVVHAGWMRAYGNAIMIDHGGGYTTLYGHCSALLVSEGAHVAQGQPIARVGSTGWSTGPHCHWSVYRNGTAINPLSVR